MEGRAACDRDIKGLAERQPRRRDLLLLGRDDFLRDPPQLLIMPVAQLGLRHVNRTLLMGNHHVDGITIDIGRSA
jgi:hypothetical protein